MPVHALRTPCTLSDGRPLAPRPPLPPRLSRLAQVAFADMLLLNKIDLVPDEAKLAHLEGRLRSLNKWAPITRCQDAAVMLEAVLGEDGQVRSPALPCPSLCFC